MRSRFNINKYSNLVQRAITSLVGAALILAALIYSDWTYFLIFGTILGMSQMEFYKLSGLDGMLPLKSFGTILGLLIFALTFMVEKEHLPHEYLYLIFPLVSLTFFIKLYKKTDKKPFTGVAYTYLGIFYVAVPISLLNLAVFSVDAVYHYTGSLFYPILGHILNNTLTLLLVYASNEGLIEMDIQSTDAVSYPGALAGILVLILGFLYFKKVNRMRDEKLDEGV